MGRALIKEVLETDGVELSGGLEHAKSEFLGKDLGALVGIDPIGIEVSDDVNEVIAKADAIINFTTPEATFKIAEIASANKKIHIIGTTGFTEAQRSQLSLLASDSVIVQSNNMSVGVNLLLGLAEQVASKLPANEYDIEILEMHHNQKVDSPSGTALSLGEAVAAGRGVELDEVAQRTRDGIIGKRKEGEIGFATLRGGGVIGEHSVIFASDNDIIELSHRAHDRGIFASGAVRAAIWAKKQRPGLYSMHEVLGL